MALTDRQIKLIKTIVEEYSQTAKPVSSDVLDRKYQIGVSPATIRNEMVSLTKEGYLAKPHSSAGRIPTPKAIRFYVDQLLEEKSLSVAEEVNVKEKIWDSRFDLSRLLRDATKILSQKTGTLAIALTDDDKAYHSGYANILDIPEFFDIEVTRTVLSIIDEFEQLADICQESTSAEPLHIIIGDELGIRHLDTVSFIYSDFVAGKHTGQIGIIGPSRLDYSQIIPVVRYLGNLINEIGKSW